MSGGPFGRGKAPERACLKLEHWPTKDRSLWIAAKSPADPFVDGGGTRHHLRPHSNRKVEAGYGRWLTFLGGRGLLNADCHPAERITPSVVKDYVWEMQSFSNKKNSILCRLQELADMAKAIATDIDWSFIARLAAWVRAKPEVPKDKRSRMVGSEELFILGIRLMSGASSLPTPRLAAIDFRDGLMISTLALLPLRRGNFVALTMGGNLVRNGTGWSIVLSGAVTKNHSALEFDWPQQLLQPLETYLAVHRPVLSNLVNRWTAPIGDRLWVSSQASPLTEMAFYDIMSKRTKTAFGRSINPHLVRDEAATTLAICEPEHVRSAAALLGHRNLATTEKYYQQAKSVEASRSLAEMITGLRHQHLIKRKPSP